MTGQPVPHHNVTMSIQCLLDASPVNLISPTMNTRSGVPYRSKLRPRCRLAIAVSPCRSRTLNKLLEAFKPEMWIFLESSISVNRSTLLARKNAHWREPHRYLHWITSPCTESYSVPGDLCNSNLQSCYETPKLSIIAKSTSDNLDR